jgi:hypothetical protein
MKLLKRDKIDIVVKNESSENRTVRLFGAFIQGVGNSNNNQLFSNSIASGTIPIAFEYSALTNKFYLADAANLLIYDSNFTLVNTVALGFTARFTFVNPVNNELIIGRSGSFTVTRFNVLTETTIGTFSISPNTNPSGCGYNPATGNLYFPCTSTATLAITNATTYAYVGNHVTTNIGGSCQVTYNPLNESIYIANRSVTGNLIVGDNTDTFTDIPFSNVPNDTAYNPETQLLYLVTANDNTIYSINSSNVIVASNVLPYGSPQFMAYNNNDGCLYIYFNTEKVIAKFDKDLILIDTFTINPTTTNAYLLIAENNVYALSSSTNQVFNIAYSTDISIDGNSLPFINTDTGFNPIKVNKLVFISNSNSQLSNIFQVKTKMLTGWEVGAQLTPLSYFSSNMPQTVITVDFKRGQEWFFDGYKYLEFVLNANTSVQLTMYFEQFRNEGFLIR